MKVCIFVDGENFRHSICDLFTNEFTREDYLPKEAQWESFFDDLCDKVPWRTGDRLRTYWYAIDSVDFFPWRFPPARSETGRLRSLLRKHDPYRERLDGLEGDDLIQEMQGIVKALIDKKIAFGRRFDGWKRIHAGISSRHNSVEFRHAGGIRYDLFNSQLGEEKAVDVKLATDLIILSSTFETAILVSGDQDYVPAVQAIKDMGKRVANVSFKTRGGKLLPGGARRLNQAVDACIELTYDEFRAFMNFQEPAHG